MNCRCINIECVCIKPDAEIYVIVGTEPKTLAVAITPSIKYCYTEAVLPVDNVSPQNDPVLYDPDM